MNTRILIGARMNVLPDEVVILMASENYSTVYFVNGKSIMVATTLKKLQARFNNLEFFRPHKSYLVNLNHIQKCEFNMIEMENKMQIPVARRKRNLFKKTWLKS